MKLVIAATPDVALASIERLKSEHQVTIVTQPDRPAGRGKQLKASPIAKLFPDALKPNNETELAQIITGSDLLITIGYGRILKAETLSIPTFGGINLHFSLLPKWRGAAPVQRAIEAGDKASGVTVFQMDSGMDTGPIWEQIEYQIPYGANSVELFKALSIIGVDALVSAIEKIQSGSKPTPQSGAVSIAAKISKQEGRINWHLDAESIGRKIRAFASNPGVFTTIRGEQIKINEAHITVGDYQPGELTNEGVVGTSAGAVQLVLVTPAGKRTMQASDWLNGFKLKPGERFE
ncbi:MAG: hypothetical protein RL193_1069 [Actinomycetota bacterium]|jgi:methionyl-tRNA formyltransferase